MLYTAVRTPVARVPACLPERMLHYLAEHMLQAVWPLHSYPPASMYSASSTLSIFCLPSGPCMHAYASSPASMQLSQQTPCWVHAALLLSVARPPTSMHTASWVLVRCCLPSGPCMHTYLQHTWCISMLSKCCFAVHACTRSLPARMLPGQLGMHANPAISQQAPGACYAACQLPSEGEKQAAPDTPAVCSRLNTCCLQHPACIMPARTPACVPALISACAYPCSAGAACIRSLHAYRPSCHAVET